MIKHRNSPSFESLKLNISFEKSNFELIGIYRPPSKSIKNFLENFKDFEKKNNISGKTIILGDFNINTLKRDRSVEDYKNLLSVSNLK